MALAARYAQGRIMAFGGGGYDTGNLSMAWCAVLEGLIEGAGKGGARMIA